jgi:hypothetical protein
VIEDAPLYAPAWAGLGNAHFRSAFQEMPPLEAWPRAVSAAQRALELDSTLSEAHVVLAAYEMFGRWDLPAARP